jgi:hypothetical protein
MTKEEYLAIAASRYEELETLNEKGDPSEEKCKIGSH